MVETADSQKELREGKNLMKNPFPALSLALEKKNKTDEARSEGYVQWECIRHPARDFCLGCHIETSFVLFYFPPS